MKCPTCKYDEDEHPDPYRVRSFFRVRGGFFVERHRTNDTEWIGEMDLWACPKCGSVKMQHWSIDAGLVDGRDETK